MKFRIKLKFNYNSNNNNNKFNKRILKICYCKEKGPNL